MKISIIYRWCSIILHSDLERFCFGNNLIAGDILMKFKILKIYLTLYFNVI